MGPQKSSHSYLANPKNENVFININGKLFHRSEAKISVFDSGFLLGDGIWEGIRLNQSKLMFIEDHLDRLFKSAEGISLKITLSKDEIIHEIDKVLIKNSMKDNVHIRLIISRGDKITPYQNPNANVGPINFVIIPEYKKTDPKIYEDGIKIGRVPIIRPPENILSTHYNTLSKLNCILASIEANKLSYDEGIMNDPNGYVSTCNSTNLFFIKKNKVLTSRGEYCLNGIKEEKQLKLQFKQYPIIGRRLYFDYIEDCSEALTELLLVLYQFQSWKIEI